MNKFFNVTQHSSDLKPKVNAEKCKRKKNSNESTYVSLKLIIGSVGREKGSE